MTDLRTWMSLFETPASDTVAPRGNLLLELDWYDKSPLTQTLLRNRGRWIHFSNGAPNRGRTWYNNTKLEPEPNRDDYKLGGYQRERELKRLKQDQNRIARRNAVQNVPKLGFNPSKMWRDPHGIYFYPVDHLLAGTERTRSGQQYGTDMAFYYVCEVNLADPRGVNLGTITWPELEAIADRNGWREAMDAFRALPPEQQKAKLPDYADHGRPGSFLWHFVELLINDGKTTWVRAFKWISFIRDPGLAIIHSNEPDQLIVFDPSIIRVVEQGENKPVTRGEANVAQGWAHVRLAIMKALRGEVGGDLVWKDKKPTLTFKLGMATFTVQFSEHIGSGGLGHQGLYMTYQFGRAKGSFSVGVKTMEEFTQPQIVEHILQQVRRIGAHKTDLLFKPAMSIEQAEAFGQSAIGDGTPLSYETTIYNERERRYNSVVMYGRAEHEVSACMIEHSVGLSVSPDDFSISAGVSINGKGVFSASSTERRPASETDAALDELAAKVIESIEINMRRLGPKGYTSYSWQKFEDPEMFQAFQGWLVVHCGLDLGGRLRRHYADQVAAYESFADKRELAYRIQSVFSRY